MCGLRLRCSASVYVESGYEIITRYRDARHSSLYLALFESGFLRIIFPPSPFPLLFSIVILTGAPCVSISSQILFKCGKIPPAVVITACWLFLAAGVFPLIENRFYINIFYLSGLNLTPAAGAAAGLRAFKTGEAAA